MIGYKVVCKTKEENVYSSVFATGGYIEYRLNEETYRNPQNGPLAVFTNLDAAEYFYRNYDGDAIFRCEYTRSKDDRLWETNNGECVYCLDCNLPNGTDFADIITLLERI